MTTQGVPRRRWLRWSALVTFGLGFGYVEATVVHYLRLALGDRFSYDVAARRICGDTDVFFLAPVAPVGPVATAVVASTAVLLGASWPYLRPHRWVASR